MIYTLWSKDGGEEITLVAGAEPPRPVALYGEGHALLVTFEVESDEEACHRRNLFMGWEPYQPMEEL